MTSTHVVKSLVKHVISLPVTSHSKVILTGKEYKTTAYDKLSCGSSNIIYGIHCLHCGLVYVGETGRSLRSRMNGHRSAIKKGGQSLLYRHFHQPNHSVDDMRVQILEKIYHSSGSLSLSTPLRRERELFWIKEFGTAKPYGFTLLFIIPHTVLLAFIQPEAETLDFLTHALPRNL